RPAVGGAWGGAGGGAGGAGVGGVGCRTLFATHYHELTELGKALPGVRNLTMGVREHEGRVVFLKTVEDGAADRSYGIHVAELAGVPAGVVHRARSVLSRLEARRAALSLDSSPAGRPHQPNLFPGEGRGEEARVLEELRATDERTLSPLEALLLVHRLRKKLGLPS
ncbi:MAG: hypothetical protein AB1347_03245, partial [Acidobacteriota bacterium]